MNMKMETEISASPIQPRVTRGRKCIGCFSRLVSKLRPARRAAPRSRSIRDMQIGYPTEFRKETLNFPGLSDEQQFLLRERSLAASMSSLTHLPLPMPSDHPMASSRSSPVLPHSVSQAPYMSNSCTTYNISRKPVERMGDRVVKHVRHASLIVANKAAAAGMGGTERGVLMRLDSNVV